MRKRAWILCGLAVLLLACPAVAAKKEGAKKPDKAGKKDKPKKGDKGKLRGHYAIMASVLELNDDQKAKLTEAIAARDAALAEWDEGEDGKKLAELLAKAKEADKDAAKEIRKEAAALRKERAELAGSQKATQAMIAEILTDEQKTKWEGHQLYTQMMRQFKKVGPTEEQEGQIRALCAAKAADAIAAAGDAKGLKKLRGDLAAAIIADILTDEQRAKATAKKEKPAGKGKKDKKEK